MNNKIFFLIIVNIIIFSKIFGQENIQTGFDLLEKQKYQEAYTFFQKYTKDNPKNKGALIGLGRALGLKGEADAANHFFDSLQVVFPKDLEIQLNLAESILWQKKAIEGEKTYRQLCKQYPKNEVCFIGLGNSLSMQQRYDEALPQYEMAAKLNPKLLYTAVLIKNAYLNIAYQRYTKAQYADSKLFYYKVLSKDSANIEATSGLGNVYLVEDSLKKATQYFEKWSKINGQEAKGLIMLGYTSKLDGKYNKALIYNTRALAFTNPSDTVAYLHAASNLLYAYLWNNKINRASRWYNQLAINYPNQNALIVPHAQLAIFKGRSLEAAKILKTILKRDSSSFDANLGLTDINFGLGDYKKANTFIKKTLQFYPNQPDANFVQRKIHKAMTIQNNFKWNYFQDNNKNYSNQYTYLVNFPLTWQSNLLLEYKNLQIGKKSNDGITLMHTLSGAYLLRPKAGWQLAFQGTYNEVVAQNRAVKMLYKISAAHRIEGGHFLELITNKELFYYSSDLLQKNITTQSIGLIYNGKINNILGCYSNLQHSNFSDKNKKNSIYVALYYTMPTKNFKIGVSSLYLDFALQVPAIYYSPDGMSNTECFIEYNNFLLQEKKWQYSIELATGLLKEKEQKVQNTYRVSASLSHRFGFDNQWFIKGTYGNSSQAQLNLYSVSLLELGVKIVPESLLMNKWR